MMEKVIASALILTIAGFSNGVVLPGLQKGHEGHDHQHGHHHDGVVEVVMEHLGKNKLQSNMKTCSIIFYIGYISFLDDIMFCF